METHTLPDPTSGRHYGMDWLRIGAFALLILYHIGMGFVPWDWHVKWPETPGWVQYPMLATNGWRLALLFLVSGFASAALLAKLGQGAYLRSRMARLWIPLLFGIVVIVPVQPWIELQFKYGYAQGFAHFWLHDYFRFGTLEGIVLPTWQHLWFVVYLIAYTLVAALLAVLVPRLTIAALLRALERGLAGRLILMVPLAWFAIRPLLLGDHEDTHALVDDGPAHFIWFSFFLLGMALRHSHGLWQSIRKSWVLAAVLSVAAYALMLGLIIGGSAPASPLVENAFEAARLVQAWCAIVALLGFADRYWNRDHALRPMLNEAVFPFYIIHQSIIVLLIWLLLGSGLPGWAGFAVTLGATAAGCWLFYRIGRCVPGLRLLIGLRGWRAPRLQAQGIRAMSAA
ncbi:acyltransferase family protein [Erythrobacter sp.]|uniref:acyltransferase family protein n=1 Tax=Erythrobacter sp. TaxID=1042 RepID=UPI001AFE174A|nr:acyltransferase family protein [Erythrobacter sp.]MBO6527787.1 acyltransferase family protein [Erythrobacter sp.]MBO6531263.1 acyltransferase family protein [Erythrobacter sp.]